MNTKKWADAYSQMLRNVRVDSAGAGEWLIISTQGGWDFIHDNIGDKLADKFHDFDEQAAIFDDPSIAAMCASVGERFDDHVRMKCTRADLPHALHSFVIMLMQLDILTSALVKAEREKAYSYHAGIDKGFDDAQDGEERPNHD